MAFGGVVGAVARFSAINLGDDVAFWGLAGLGGAAAGRRPSFGRAAAGAAFGVLGPGAWIVNAPISLAITYVDKDDVQRGMGLARGLADRALMSAEERAMRDIVADATARAPVASGRLRGSIQGTVDRSGAKVRAGPLVYAPVVHWGWPRRNIEPTLFLSRAWARVAKRYPDEVMQRVESDVLAPVGH